MDNYDRAVQTLRFLAIDAVEKAHSGHPAPVEADITTPWVGTGSNGIHLGIDREGSSGPYKQLASAFGLTPEQVVDSILKELA